MWNISVPNEIRLNLMSRQAALKRIFRCLAIATAVKRAFSVFEAKQVLLLKIQTIFWASALTYSSLSNKRAAHFILF